jgi:hypothetical protein
VLGKEEKTVPPFEDRNIFVLWAPSMSWVVETTNKIGFAHLILHIVPADKPGAYWLVCKKDSWLMQQIADNPSLT